MALTAGAKLGPYEILQAVGAGGFGQVYKARDTRLDRFVAIKVLPEHLSQNPSLRARFEREAQILAKLSHPHICPVFDVGRQDAIDYLVMEYLEGETLETRLRKGALPLDQAMRYAINMADALAAAHRAGITHRDLKPGNVMLTGTGPKLLDFGLAKQRTAAPFTVESEAPTLAPSLTTEGTILGTLQYMAPEQLEGREADGRTDIFALGAVLHEMVTGQKVFQGKSQMSLIAAIMEHEPPPLTSLQPLAPRALEYLVADCLSKDPEARPQSAHDVTRELKWIASGALRDSEPANRRSAKRERLAWAGFAATFAFALIVSLNGVFGPLRMSVNDGFRFCHPTAQPGSNRKQRFRPTTVRSSSGRKTPRAS